MKYPNPRGGGRAGLKRGPPEVSWRLQLGPQETDPEMGRSLELRKLSEACRGAGRMGSRVLCW